MTRITTALTWLKSSLPDLGIFAFALASTWALYQLFNNSARHPTILYIAPAALVEIVTAWLMKNATSAAYQFTRSRITKQDRRFHLIILSACLVLAAPTIVASTLANGYEFNGSVWLALLFPAASVGCAVGGAIPRTIARHERGKTDENKAEVRELREKLRALRTSRQLREPERTDFEQICASLNGKSPRTARGVNKLLNDNGFYSVADSTARSWAK